MDTTLAYLAGALDSDGYFTIRRSTYHLRVRGDARVPVFSERIGLKQVTPVIPELLAETFGGSCRTERPSALRGRPLHTWQVTDRKAMNATRMLLPYLRIKRQQAEILLELRRLKEMPRSGTITVMQKTRSGVILPFRKRVLSSEDVAKRQELFETIKLLNDTRPNQPKLG